MEIALERIANMRDNILNLHGLGLTELPQLVSEDPPTLKYLNCECNRLTELPQLPSTLVGLYCRGNQLTKLPQLVSECPSTLVDLYCADNQLTELPQLPSTLVRLDCDGNQITELPQLPSTLMWMNRGNNPIQYPPADVLEGSIVYIREWMSENPPTFVKSANKV
jgi:Leucine-rich repeat (LRR) protein